jgi:hypothetical protein
MFSPQNKLNAAMKINSATIPEIIMTKKFSKIKLMAALTAMFVSSNVFSQPYGGADFVSRYIWRGLEINKSFNVQPSFGYGAGGFDIGLWGSYAISDVANTLQSEIDLYASYTFPTSGGDIAILFTDYYFPDGNIRLGDFDDGTGAHTLELGVGYSGPGSFPINVAVYMNVYNDDGNSAYIEVGYPVSLPGDYSMDLFAGATPGSDKNPDYYGTDKFGFLNIGFKVSKDLVITDTFSIPGFIAFIMNPTTDKAHLTAGFSIGI